MAMVRTSKSSDSKPKKRKPRAWYFPEQGGIRIRPLRMPSGNIAFRVEVPESITGKRTFKQFKSTDEAESYASVMLVQRKNNGLAAFALTDKQRNLAQEAFARLASENFSADQLATAVDFFIKHHRPEGGDITIDALVDRYVREKQNGNAAKGGRPLRERSIADLENRLGIFSRAFGSRLAKNIAKTE